jgi:hypothetical protein
MDVPLARTGFMMLVSTVEVRSQSSFCCSKLTLAVHDLMMPDFVYEMATSRANVSKKPEMTGAVPAGSTGSTNARSSPDPRSKDPYSFMVISVWPFVYAPLVYTGPEILVLESFRPVIGSISGGRRSSQAKPFMSELMVAM